MRPKERLLRTHERLHQPLLLLPPPQLFSLLHRQPLLALVPLTLALAKRLQPPVMLLPELFTGFPIPPLFVIARFAPPLRPPHQLAHCPEQLPLLLVLLLLLPGTVCLHVMTEGAIAAGTTSSCTGSCIRVCR